VKDDDLALAPRKLAKRASQSLGQTGPARHGQVVPLIARAVAAEPLQRVILGAQRPPPRPREIRSNDSDPRLERADLFAARVQLPSPYQCLLNDILRSHPVGELSPQPRD